MDNRRLQASRAALCKLYAAGLNVGLVLSPFKYDLTNIDSSFDIRSETV